MSTRSEISKALKLAMHTEDYNSSQLADLLGISRSYVSLVINGKASTEKIDEILKELGYSLEVVLVKN
jgi:predicted XRE-type DNA-binding protein